MLIYPKRILLGLFSRMSLITVIALAMFTFAGCGEQKTDSEEKPFHVGLVFDVGGIGDKSFNDLAHAGLLKAKADLGVTFEYFEPTQSADRESALRLFAQGDADLIIGVGFLFSDDILSVATDFTNKRFVCVDYTWTEGVEVPDNLLGLKFREEEGSFMVGALAAMVSTTGIIGFVGGMDIPLIHKFEAGYRAGAQHVNPEIEVIINYAGVTGEAFKNPTKGKELGLSQYEQGADIIFHASGSTGLGVFEAAREKGTLAIGVDADQADEAPGLVLTSMVKQVDVSVYQAIREAVSGSFEGGIEVFGLKEDGVGYIQNESNAKWFTSDITARLAQIRSEIASGDISVPAQ